MRSLVNHMAPRAIPDRSYDPRGAQGRLYFTSNPRRQDAYRLRSGKWPYMARLGYTGCSIRVEPMESRRGAVGSCAIGRVDHPRQRIWASRHDSQRQGHQELAEELWSHM